MPDTSQRELGRLVLCGDVDASAKLLRSHIRSGDLTEKQVSLAAYLGHPGALVAAAPSPLRIEEGYLCCCGDLDTDHGQTVESYTHTAVHACEHYGTECECDVTVRYEQREFHSPSALKAWLVGLEHYGKETIVRASVACGRASLPGWVERNPRIADENPKPLRDIEAAERWCRCPCEAHLDSWDGCVGTHTQAWVPESPRDWFSVEPASYTTAILPLFSEDELRQAVQLELIPLYLGVKDPIKHRERWPRPPVTSELEWLDRYKQGEYAAAWLAMLGESLPSDVTLEEADRLDQLLWDGWYWLPPRRGGNGNEGW